MQSDPGDADVANSFLCLWWPTLRHLSFGWIQLVSLSVVIFGAVFCGLVDADRGFVSGMDGEHVINGLTINRETVSSTGSTRQAVDCKQTFCPHSPEWLFFPPKLMLPPAVPLC
jgi:hypothetical protein